MGLYVVIGHDREGGLELRRSLREAHLAYVRKTPPGFIRIAGPFLDPAGEMCGSMFIFEAESREAIDAQLAADPYVTGGLFTSVEVRPWRVTIPWS